MNQSSTKLIVVCLEGCHGSGKSSLCDAFESQGYEILDEAFMDMPSHALHPQSLLMETSWICSWFERVLRLANYLNQHENKTQPIIYISDRSPFSAVFYSRNRGHLLEPIVRAQMKEVEEARHILFYTVHISVEPELLWQRIQNRLVQEPERVRYNEHKRSWMDQTQAFYNSFQWDLTISNNHQPIPSVMEEIVNQLSIVNPDIQIIHSQQSKQSIKKRIASRLTATSSSFSVLSTDSETESYSEEILSPTHQECPSIISFNNQYD